MFWPGGDYPPGTISKPKESMKLLDRILAIVQARLAAARLKIAEYEAAKAPEEVPAPEATSTEEAPNG